MLNNMVLSQKIAQTFKNRCLICFRRYNHIHHIIPLSLGGTNAEENLIPLCFKHHIEIHARGAFNSIKHLQELRSKRIKWLPAPDISQTTTNTKPSFSGTTAEDQQEENSEI